MNVFSQVELSKPYGPRQLFEKFSFAMAQGEKMAFMAPNGSGKSTVLKAIAGNEPTRHGAIGE